MWIDEVGRGPLAGPVVACAVILNKEHQYLGLDDSKKVSATKRKILNEQLKEGVYDYAYGIASAEEIDEFNIYNATKLAMKRAINQLTEQPNHLLIDAMTLIMQFLKLLLLKEMLKVFLLLLLVSWQKNIGWFNGGSSTEISWL